MEKLNIGLASVNHITAGLGHGRIFCVRYTSYSLDPLITRGLST